MHTDNPDSPIAYSGATGTQQGTWSYDAFGLQGQPTSSAEQYTYTGQTCYCLGALYNYKARTYDPNFGRFLEADPIGQAGGVNTYAYVGNDPVNESDPSGKCMIGDCSDIGSFGSGAWLFGSPVVYNQGYVQGIGLTDGYVYVANDGSCEPFSCANPSQSYNVAALATEVGELTVTAPCNAACEMGRMLQGMGGVSSQDQTLSPTADEINWKQLGACILISFRLCTADPEHAPHDYDIDPADEQQLPRGKRPKYSGRVVPPKGVPLWQEFDLFVRVPIIVPAHELDAIPCEFGNAPASCYAPGA